jgi:hypothetical protein
MDEPSRATGSLGARRVSDSPVIELIATDPRAARVVLGLFAVQLLMSIRFFFKYADARPGVLYGLFVVAALGACGVVLNVRRLLVFFTRPWVFVMGLTSLFLLVLFAYPRADALKEVGRGSDQDDCVRTLVGNVFALKEPYGFGYFGDPCSTGPTEFFVYFPVQVFSQYFIVVPVLSVLLGYWVLNQVTDRPTAIFLSLSQFASWLFLELSAVGSDLIVIGWLFAAATVASRRGMRNGNKALLVAGGVAYCLFAGSRVPLILVDSGRCGCCSSCTGHGRCGSYCPPRSAWPPCTSAATRSHRRPFGPGTWSPSRVGSSDTSEVTTPCRCSSSWPLPGQFW